MSKFVMFVDKKKRLKLCMFQNKNEKECLSQSKRVFAAVSSNANEFAHHCTVVNHMNLDSGSIKMMKMMTRRKRRIRRVANSSATYSLNHIIYFWLIQTTAWTVRRVEVRMNKSQT